METKTIQRGFIAVCALLLLFPIMRFNWTGTVAEGEKRNLAALPHFFHKDGKINSKYFAGCDKWLADRFGGRETLISLYHVTDFISVCTSNNLVIFGKKGWLFYAADNDDANLYDFLKRNLFTDEELNRAVAVLKDRNNWCKEHGIKFLAVICPNKHNIYGEYYPFKRPEGITLTEQLIAALEGTDVPFVYPRDLLIASKAKYDVPLYYKTDTHWNSLGAMIASQEIGGKLCELFPDTTFPNVETDYHYEETPGKGDIVPMMGLKKYGTDYSVTVKPAAGEWSDYYTYEKYENKPNGGVIITKGKNPALPKAVVIHDSFAISLEPFLSAQFSSAEYWYNRYERKDYEQLLVDKPDIVIWERVERYTSILPYIDGE